LTHSGRLTHKVVTRQPWIRRRSGKVRRLQTDILTTEPRRQLISFVQRCLQCYAGCKVHSITSVSSGDIYILIFGHNGWKLGNHTQYLTVFVKVDSLKVSVIMWTPKRYIPVWFRVFEPFASKSTLGWPVGEPWGKTNKRDEALYFTYLPDTPLPPICTIKVTCSDHGCNQIFQVLS